MHPSEIIPGGAYASDDYYRCLDSDNSMIVCRFPLVGLNNVVIRNWF